MKKKIPKFKAGDAIKANDLEKGPVLTVVQDKRNSNIVYYAVGNINGTLMSSFAREIEEKYRVVGHSIVKEGDYITWFNEEDVSAGKISNEQSLVITELLIRKEIGI